MVVRVHIDPAPEGFLPVIIRRVAAVRRRDPIDAGVDVILDVVRRLRRLFPVRVGDPAVVEPVIVRQPSAVIKVVVRGAQGEIVGVDAAVPVDVRPAARGGAVMIDPAAHFNIEDAVVRIIVNRDGFGQILELRLRELDMRREVGHMAPPRGGVPVYGHGMAARTDGDAPRRHSRVEVHPVGPLAVDRAVRHVHRRGLLRGPLAAPASAGHRAVLVISEDPVERQVVAGFRETPAREDGAGVAPVLDGAFRVNVKILADQLAVVHDLRALAELEPVSPRADDLAVAHDDHRPVAGDAPGGAFAVRAVAVDHAVGDAADHGRLDAADRCGRVPRLLALDDHGPAGPDQDLTVVDHPAGAAQHAAVLHGDGAAGADDDGAVQVHDLALLHGKTGLHEARDDRLSIKEFEFVFTLIVLVTAVSVLDNKFALVMEHLLLGAVQQLAVPFPGSDVEAPLRDHVGVKAAVSVNHIVPAFCVAAVPDVPRRISKGEFLLIRSELKVGSKLRIGSQRRIQAEHLISQVIHGDGVRIAGLAGRVRRRLRGIIVINDL